ncbi:MAG: Holliday junction DNA helicase RuvB [Candidatus Liptonbacteria bacterium GWC1_60_9]|uniref:Holliday junction branch migration complex subunit RuvB n=3 Tax=Candidatus Liptoniibacteriota TaxID=1817909 RepID=A0A1G2CLN4_9BACT|nr:MAG: Holliday junction DNA helicase RuvB [Candidatus Liptonbacteria bacterium GWC1_60_9]OGZ00048.1 MAG: Holliday junction DNA helicase RuvB [Candidatus Liptonbacteria bacterium RIFCSPHIGHO2_12_FULL_60_13]OGZ02313.1 MAG: Holliday junction DNA helicase RuvB [Candidatus Liptonbacteria bacterium RIFCSPLOWO2_12_FULL_60_15]
MPESTHNQDDLNVDLALRPSTWKEYVGQDKAKQNLAVIIEAARIRHEPIDHLLFYGQAGLGKTTLAYLVAKEAGAALKVTSGPAIEKMGDLAAILSNLDPGDVLFIDEAHRMNRLIEEMLYPAMETRKLHLVVGKGPGARAFSLDLPPFTIIAATTRVNLLSGPLRSRFGATFRLDYYELDDIKAIIERSAKLLGVKVMPEAVEVLGRASRATPRVANRLLKRARDFALVRSKGVVTSDIAAQTLALLEVDHLGLEPSDRRLLSIVIEKFNGGPVGLSTLAAALNDDKGTVEEVYEPYLMSIGLLHRTPLGRMATPAAYRHLGIAPKDSLL